MNNWSKLIFSDQPFEDKKREVFNYQYQHNPVYHRYCDALDVKLVEKKREGDDFETLLMNSFQDDEDDFPLLSIQAYKDTEVITKWQEHSTSNIQHSTLTFKSSGTGSMQRSVHEVPDAELYRQSVLQGFNHFYDLENAVILGYTPRYNDNPHSSLIWMINELIKQDSIKKSRFLPLDKPLSQGEVNDIAASGKQLILFGAAFGLMDLVEMSSVELPSNSVVIETGGMKTHRRAMDRKVMHKALAQGFNIDVSRIHSEYGMCELLSQAYATGGPWFRTVPWMQVSVRDPDDPQRQLSAFQEGLIGVIDLANVHSCSFLLTGDKGIMDEKGRFQVLGRWNPKDLRGCNFLIDED